MCVERERGEEGNEEEGERGEEIERGDSDGGRV